MYNPKYIMKQILKRAFAKKQKKPQEKEESIWDIIRFTIIALAIVVPIRMFVAQPFIVSGDSMYPTFHNAEYLIVDELSYRLGHPKRGDVVIFRYPQNPSRYFIKRVIGLPGETVSINNNVVTIRNEEHPDGFVLDEVYLHVDTAGKTDTPLGKNEYFVMGDNRPASSDSRAWGPVPKNMIVGRALFRILPLKTMAFLPGHLAKFDDTALDNDNTN